MPGCIAAASDPRNGLHTAASTAAANPDRQEISPPDSAVAPITHWLLLSFLASVMLLAGTSEICQDVAVVPFLRIAPLALYLVSFVLCFESDRWYVRGVFAPLTATIIPLLGWLHLFGTRLHFLLQLAAWLTGLFSVFMLCHGELARLRPGTQKLTLFYLTLAAGGAAGGLLCGCRCPAAAAGSLGTSPRPAGLRNPRLLRLVRSPRLAKSGQTASTAGRRCRHRCDLHRAPRLRLFHHRVQRIHRQQSQLLRSSAN
ncbi:MAG UNVERIFIED_CONTAM: hypothetical protein LVR18_18290 [Planctomycetaceae bacterium]